MQWQHEVRYKVTLLLCLANIICYADRTNIGIAIPSFIPNSQDRGIVLSSFFYGYILTQIPAGWWATRFSVKSVLLGGVMAWTICDTSTVLVAGSMPLLVLVRVGMGCGEGVIMPCLHQFAANWFPVSERGILVSVVSSGVDLGTILSLMLSPWLMQISGHWGTIFIVFGAFSFLWLLFFIQYATSKPEQHPTIREAEKEYILCNMRNSTNDSYGSRTIAWRTMLTSVPLWSIYIAHFSFSYSWYVLLGWLPTYIDDHLGMDLRKHRLLGALPYICGYIGLILSGRMSDVLIARGFPILYVRRFMNSISFFFSALFLYLLKYASKPKHAVFLLCCALFTGRASTSGFWINMIDVGPEYAGNTMGVSNTIATISGISGNLVTGYILQMTNNWDYVFDVAALILSFGGIIFLVYSTDQNVFQKEEEAQPLLSNGCTGTACG